MLVSHNIYINSLTFVIFQRKLHYTSISKATEAVWSIVSISSPLLGMRLWNIESTMNSDFWRIFIKAWRGFEFKNSKPTNQNGIGIEETCSHSKRTDKDVGQISQDSAVDKTWQTGKAVLKGNEIYKSMCQPMIVLCRYFLFSPSAFQLNTILPFVFFQVVVYSWG